MPEQVTLVAHIKAKAGQEEELGRRLTALVEPTRAEPGCINYDLHRLNDDGSVWMLYENWVSKAALDAHFKMSYLEDFIARKDEVLAEEMDIKLYSMTSGSAPY
ncbi:putative quinol monooxygenase [Nitratireductor rhodophyticola]|uniref:Antibiotic biosynthesis monooxygenase n=1 Tax=Nitratireductor aquibiodomus RA22 TaxID=1189611 RepID=I5BVF4_9HYPH|nr:MULTISPECIES: putative quinol monooxygenase [Nitratireductor]EIM73556.1 antibiotic biosynthesis monooxygenase [Nitratireductor aquibiodomus RA22]MEC9244203.1 putative quinol monooxygenase [Pseudomonadota bacterium]WPZ15158.1 putative quinol monooxygenase [Nitratireductor rhodophyticola]